MKTQTSPAVVRSLASKCLSMAIFVSAVLSMLGSPVYAQIPAPFKFQLGPRLPGSPSSQSALRLRSQAPRPLATASKDIISVQCPPEAIALNPAVSCGYVPVPLDRKHPNREKINIYFEVYPHSMKSAGRNTSAHGLRGRFQGQPQEDGHGGLHHALLQFVGERACWQLQGFIPRMDALGARPGVTHARNVDGAKDGLQPSCVQPPVGVQHWPEVLVNLEGEAHRSLAWLLDVRLEEQALHLAPFMLLLALDRMQGELQGLRRS